MTYKYIHHIAKEFSQNTKVLLKTENTFETPYCYCATYINHKDKYPGKTFIQVDKSKIEQKQFNPKRKHHVIILNTTPKSFIGKDDFFVTFYYYIITPL